MGKIYFDYASTTPVDPDVIKAMEPYYFKLFGNPSSPHSIGQEANNALENARQTVADFISAKREEIVFNSGATEGNNQAIMGAALALKQKGNHLVVSSIEHHSALEPVERLAAQGFKITYLKPDKDGLINPTDVEQAVTSQTILVAVMHASNEIGTIQPIQEISQVSKKKQVLFLVDACQTVGHVPVNV